MARIVYIGNKEVKGDNVAQTGLTWTKGQVHEVSDEKKVAKLLEHNLIWRDATNKSERGDRGAAAAAPEGGAARAQGQPDPGGLAVSLLGAGGDPGASGNLREGAEEGARRRLHDERGRGPSATGSSSATRGRSTRPEEHRPEGARAWKRRRWRKP
jgi:hypothetical protein